MQKNILSLYVLLILLNCEKKLNNAIEVVFELVWKSKKIHVYRNKSSILNILCLGIKELFSCILNYLILPLFFLFPLCRMFSPVKQQPRLNPNCCFNMRNSHSSVIVTAYFSTVVFTPNNTYWRAKVPQSIHIASVRYCHLLFFHTAAKTARSRSLKIRKLVSAGLALLHSRQDWQLQARWSEMSESSIMLHTPSKCSFSF